MENATQALFMAAGVLIALVVISLGIMFFSSASSIGESYEIQMSAVEIQKFNNQFEQYSKQANYVKKLMNDKFHYVNSLRAVRGKEEYVFCDYNTIADVVSAINLAHNINSNNQYEQDVGVQVTITGLNSVASNISNIVGINPSIQKYFKDNKKNDNHSIYKLNDLDTKKVYDDSYSASLDLVDLNLLLQNFNTSKLTEEKERIYKYGFKGETKINPKTGLIDIVKFQLVENENYVE